MGTSIKVSGGDMNFDGAVYTTVHYLSPAAWGCFFVNEVAPPGWCALAGQDQQPQVRYRGTAWRDGQVYVNSASGWADGDRQVANGRSIWRGRKVNKGF